MKELKRPTPPVTFAYQLSYYNADHYLLSLQTPTDIPKAKKSKKRDLGPCKPVHNKRTLTMAGDIQQNAWKPTVRIGKIAAETTNPGPAIVQLPTLIGKGEEDTSSDSFVSHSFDRRQQSAGLQEEGCTLVYIGQ